MALAPEIVSEQLVAELGGVEALWYDTWLHADDIRAALGRAPEAGEGLAGGLSHVHFELTKRGWTGQADGDPLQFVLVATGRADPSTIGAGAPPNIYAD